MPKPFTSPDRLFDRTWRAGHPFGPRLSGSRRWGMTLVFLFLCTVIGGYLFLTDSDRVRYMAESYLSTLLGGPVKVGGATLSIFEGLRLDNVRLNAGGTRAPDSELLAANSFIISYSPRALLSGRLEATRIVAVEPKVYLTENLETGVWSHERLGRRNSGSGGMTLKTLPEIMLRNATLEYRQFEHGVVTSRGSIDIEGQLTPTGEGQKYAFKLQSRGRRLMGPTGWGYLVLDTREVTVALSDVVFDDNIKGMLPSLVRKYWEDHQLAGRLDLQVSYRPATAADPASFNAEIALQGVTFTVQPEEWMSDDEHRRMDALHEALHVMRLCGLNGKGLVDRFSTLLEPTALRLHDVFATFVFTEAGIDIRNFTGKLEDISFNIAGRIGGYNPSAAWDLNVRSLETRNVEIPASPRYVTSMPPAVREVYDHFRPRGECSFWMRIHRPREGERLRVTGEINILDGNFVFDKFPYPLRNATGRIALEYDESTGDGLRIDRVRGRGVEGGPNENSYVEINGTMGPFRSDVGVDVLVTGQNISSEPALMSAFPQQTRTALKSFDAPGKGMFPTFTGDFICRIIRLRQEESHWIIKTDIHLEDAAGVLVAFPYPLSGVKGQLEIHDDHVNIIDAHMQRGDASIRIDGRVSWQKSDDSLRTAPTTSPTLKPQLKIAARNVPIDGDLLSALPADRRAWLEKIGLGGFLDIDGTVRKSTAPSRDMDFDLHLMLRDGTIWPTDGTFAVSKLSGDLQLKPDRLIINSLKARRGEGDIAASGSVTWPSEPPQLLLNVDAKNLQLDRTLYQILPEAAKRGWDQVHPEGTVDATLSYSGDAGTRSSTIANAGIDPATQPTTRPSGFELTITPRKLAATPEAVPYRLEEIQGTLLVMPDKVILKDITAKHDKASIALSATGSPAPGGSWDFKLVGKDVLIDKDFRAAVPAALRDLLKSMNMTGTVDFDFSKLHVVSSNSQMSDASDSRAAARDEDEPDVDFDLSLSTDDATMEAGVPLTGIRGGAKISGATRDGELYELTGQIDAPELTLAGRAVTNFRATLHKLRGQDALQLGKMEARLAGGSMAGEVNWVFPDSGPSRYALALVMRNADVRTLTGETDQGLRGQISASLAIEGIYDDPTSRRGRGDVSATGNEMYRIPLVLGLLQITNLALPITSPFREASVRYSIEGNRVTFEQIELRAREMLMQGTGHLDFASKQVRMNFTTDSTNWPTLPLIGDLLRTARHELLQIQVRGTLEDPKVSARSMNTFTTTIDEVFRGDEEPKSPRKSK